MGSPLWISSSHQTSVALRVEGGRASVEANTSSFDCGPSTSSYSGGGTPQGRAVTISPSQLMAASKSVAVELNDQCLDRPQVTLLLFSTSIYEWEAILKWPLTLPGA